MSEAFFMVSLELFADKLMEHGRRRGLPLRETDNGYLVHTLLGELFGELTPRPFAIQESRGRRLRIVAYANGPAEMLCQQADAFADPAVHGSCDWGRFVTKPMPREWAQDRRFRFQVRVCPVVRRSGPGPRGERAGREMDAFLAHAEEHPEARFTRDTVYIDWLRAALDRSAGAELVEATMTGFSLRRFVRRDRERAPRQVPAQRNTKQGGSGRPDVTLEGVVRVVDSESFGRLLRRGIGRHRAFGFGMILLRATR